MNFAAFLETVTPTDTGLSASIPESWHQGRTAYGGLSTSLCLLAAQRALETPRPLRSALVSFAGPVAGTADVEVEPLRSGRTAASVKARLRSPAGLGTETVFTFASMRDSALSITPPGLPDGVEAPAEGVKGLSFPKGAPSFTDHFELGLAGGALPFSADTSGAPMRFWTRHSDGKARDDLVSLVCLADALPPAITTRLPDFAPLSSMSWMFDLLDDDLSTREGWYLLESRAEHARGGYSSQAMRIWTTQGRLIVTGRQMVTVFA